MSSSPGLAGRVRLMHEAGITERILEVVAQHATEANAPA